MNDNQLDQLRDTLRRETQHIHPVGLGANAVQRRGRRRRNRGRAIVAAGAATCVAGVGATVLQRRTGSPNRVAVAAQAPAAQPTLEFRVVDGTVSGSSAHFTTAAGITYELSTAPGTVGPNVQPGQAIYNTTDGQHWNTAAQDHAWISDLTQRDGVLYAIGTAPGASASDVRYLAGTSHDGGKVWSDADLPFDQSTPHATVSMTRSSFVQIASGTNETIALLSEQFWPDLDSLVAARVPGHANLTTTQTKDGFDIVDLTACATARGNVASVASTPAGVAKARSAGACTNPPVLGTISWSDLGLGGLGDLTRQQMLVSTDGTHWSAAPAPTTGPVTQLVADSTGFLMLTQNADPTVGMQAPAVTTTLFHSTDAHTWTPVATPAGMNVQSIAGDSILATDASGGLQTSTDGGTTWSVTSVSSLLPAGAPHPSVTASDAGPLGFAALVMTSNNPNNPNDAHDYLLFSTDGVNWTTTDLATVGEPTAGYAAQVTVGADHVAVDYFTAGATPGGPMKITTLLATPKS